MRYRPLGRMARVATISRVLATLVVANLSAALHRPLSNPLLAVMATVPLLPELSCGKGAHYRKGPKTDMACYRRSVRYEASVADEFWTLDGGVFDAAGATCSIIDDLVRLPWMCCSLARAYIINVHARRYSHGDT